MASIIQHAPVMRKILEQIPLLNTIALGAVSEKVQGMLVHSCPLMEQVRIEIQETGVMVFGYPVELPKARFQFVDGNLEDVEQTIEFKGTAAEFQARGSFDPHFEVRSDNKAMAAYRLGEMLANMFIPGFLSVVIDRVQWNEVVLASSWRHWRSAKIGHFEVNGELSASELKEVLWNVRPRHLLDLSVSCPDFIYNEDEVPKFDIDTVRLHGRNRWFDFKMLMGQSCRNLSVHFPGISMKEVNVFLHAWIDGEYKNLEKFQIFIESNTWESEGDDLFSGLPFELAGRTPYPSNTQDAQMSGDKNWHIKNRDGKFATLNQGRQNTWSDEETNIILTMWISKDEYPVIEDKCYYSW